MISLNRIGEWRKLLEVIFFKYLLEIRNLDQNINIYIIFILLPIFHNGSTLHSLQFSGECQLTAKEQTQLITLKEYVLVFRGSSIEKPFTVILKSTSTIIKLTTVMTIELKPLLKLLICSNHSSRLCLHLPQSGQHEIVSL